MDPCVIRVRCKPIGPEFSHSFDLAEHQSRVVTTPIVQHLCLRTPSTFLRLDVIEGSVLDGPVALEPAVHLAAGLECQIVALRRIDRLLRGLPNKPASDPRLTRLVMALRVADALAAGASLRVVAREILEADDWPGDGDWAKSWSRRVTSLARALLIAGPAGVLRRRV